MSPAPDAIHPALRPHPPIVPALVLSGALLAAVPLLATPPDCPLHAEHAGTAATSSRQAAPSTAETDARRHAGVDARGDIAMGFSQAATRHHFRLTESGGAIEVTVRDPKDVASLRQVRHHLEQTARAFAVGDFHSPRAVHAMEPPGAAEMSRLRGEIDYRYEELPEGGRIVVTTRTPAALAAVHDFLRFQIRDHETGDPETLSP